MAKAIKILAVDDLEESLDQLKNILEHKYSILTASNGNDAVQKAISTVPDIVLLDIGLPDKDGYNVCKEIKSHELLSLTKVIMVSGRILVDERLKAYEVGADDYITKPFDQAELLAKVKVFARLNSVEKDLTKLNQSLESKVRSRTEQLLKTQKMAFLGLHTTEIVQNLKDPLFSILGNAETLEETLEKNKHIDSIISSCRDVYKAVRSLMKTGEAEQNADTQEINLNDVLKNELGILESNNFVKQNISTKINVVELPTVSGVYSHFSQSICNLLRNAVDSMKNSEGKNLTIKTAKKKQNIIVTITDTGAGIKQENMPKIFDAFYTTHDDESSIDQSTHTGFGLTYTKRIIEAYFGTIEIKSVENVGTTVVLSIPYGSMPASNL